MTPEKPPVTRLLAAIDAGDASAWSRLIPLVDGELRRIASARLARMPRRPSLCVTDLVHETYARLLHRAEAGWGCRRHFYAAVAQAMRSLLVDHARSRCRIKRGGGWQRVTLGDRPAAEPTPAVELIALDQALAKLGRINPQQHEVVLLRYFGGLSIDEVAAAIGASRSTVDRQWRFARAWLKRELDGGSAAEQAP